MAPGTTLTADLTHKAFGAGAPTATSDLTARSSHINAALTVDGTSKIGNAETDTETGDYGMNLVGDLEAHAKAAGVEREVDLFEVSSQVKPTVTGSSGSLTTKAIARNGGSPLTTTSRFSSSSHTQGQIEGRATADANKAFSSLNVLGEGLPLWTYGTSLTAETDDDAEDVKATTNVRNTQNRPVTEAGLTSNAQVESNLDKVTVALAMNGEDIDGLGGAASGAAEGAPEASITLSGTSGATPAIVGGKNEAHVQPGINPFVVSTLVDATVKVEGDYSTKAVATGEKLRTVLMEDQEPDNGTFDFGIKELVLTIAGQSTDTFSSVEFELWPDTNNDGVEDGARVWSAYATFALDYNYTLGVYEGDISAGGAWGECDFLVAPPSGVPSAAFTATLRPESKLQHAVVADTTQDYIFISKYRAEATGGAVPAAAAGVYYEKCYAPPVPETKANLTAYRPRHGADYAPFARTAVPDSDDYELSETLGPGIRINPARDPTDPLGDPDDQLLGEDDLIEVTIKREQGLEDLRLERQNPNLKVYRDPLGTLEINFNDKNQTELLGIGDAEMKVYVEWAGPGHGTADLSVKSCHDGVALDTLKFHTFQSIIVALGGEGQVPSDPPNPLHGTFQIAVDLYRAGYDVHMYDEDFVNEDVGGIVYDEVVTGITHRGVNQVAILGYSHGGGSTYHLANHLNSNRMPIGRTFAIKFTSYVDAVSDDELDVTLVDAVEIPGDFFPEKLRPPGSLYHSNHYQLAGNTLDNPVLNGAPTSAASGGANFELNVETRPWGTGATHKLIDDYEQVKDAIKLQLESENYAEVSR